MSNTPDPSALAGTVNCDALYGEISVIGDDADDPRGQELDDAQETVRGARENGVLRRGVGGRKCAERIDGVWVPANGEWECS